MMDPVPGVLSSVMKQNTLKKVKPKLKPKYFVLHKDDRDQAARLEYYDAVKHWENRKKPKRVIFLKTCFSVNEMRTSKVDFGLILYTKDDSFQISFETEDERDAWLSTIRALNKDKDNRPMFEHVWAVKIRERGLGRAYEGEYRLCLNERTVIFVKKAFVDPSFAFPLEVIRRCGHSDNFFNLEVGRQASTGPGEFWMEVEDALIAQNVHHAIIGVMNNPKDNESEASFRPKGSSFSSKSGTTSSGLSSSRSVRSKPGGNRSSKAGQSSSSSAASSRNRSGSIDSRSTITTTSTLTSGGAAGGTLKSTDNLSVVTVDGLSTLPAGSRSSTPNRSLTPDILRPITPRLSELGLPDGPGSTPADTSPFSSVHFRSSTSNSLSSSSVNSWTGKDQTPADQSVYADMTQGSTGTAPGGHNSTVLIDGSYADMVPVTVQPASPMYIASSRLPSSRQPDRTPSYLSHDEESAPYLAMGPLSSSAKAEAPAYLDMAPSGSPANAGDTSYLDMAPLSSSVKSNNTNYLEMTPTSVSDNYLDMAPTSADQSPYLDMAPTSSSLTNSPYLEMTPTGTAAPANTLYVDMSPSLGSSPSTGDSAYLDMAPVSSSVGASTRPCTTADFMDKYLGGRGSNSLQLSTGALGDGVHPYLDMSGRDVHDLPKEDSVPLRHYSVGSRPTALQKPPNPDQYVEMCRSKDFAGKSLSVPHLMPLSLASNPDLTHMKEEYPSNYPTKPDTLMLMSFDRQRTSSESLKQRPRGATWSANVRPRSSSHGHGYMHHKLSSKSTSSRESIHSTCSDYVDMRVGARTGEYVDMTATPPHPHHQRANSSRHHRKNSHPGSVTDPPREQQSIKAKLLAKLASPGRSLWGSSKAASFDGLAAERGNAAGTEHAGLIPDDLLRNPHLSHVGRRMSQPHQPIDPFPELSASSEEDGGMRSAASSFSSTRSSSSSRSSLARSDNNSLKNFIFGGGGGATQLEPDFYVECQPAKLRGGPPHLLPGGPPHLLPHSAAKISKPSRVSSFISEETPTSEPTKPASKADKKDKRSKAKRSSRADVAAVYGTTPPADTAPTYVEMTPPAPANQKLGKSPAQSTVIPSVSGVVNPLPQLPVEPSGSHSKLHQNRPPANKQHKVEASKPPLLNGQPPSVPSPSQSTMPLPIPKPQSQMPPAEADAYTTMNPLAIDDPYYVMEAPGSTRSPLVGECKPLPIIDNLWSIDDMESDTTTTVSSETTQATTTSTGTGSSGDSSQTLLLDDLVDTLPPFLGHSFSVTTKPKKTPKPVVCYIRENSSDRRIYPTPAVPAACYIRSESNVSQVSDCEGVSPTRRLPQDDILDTLAAAHEEDVWKGEEADPISPIRLSIGLDRVQSLAQSSHPSFSRSSSDSGDIPGSAAELEWQQKNRKLDLVQEDEKETSGSRDGSASSGKDGGGVVPVKSYIVDDTKPSMTRVRGKGCANAPSLPPRTISSSGGEEKAGSRHPSSSDASTLLNYVDINHDSSSAPVVGSGVTTAAAAAAAAAATTQSSSPKAADGGGSSIPVPDVIYTPIDHEKTQELSMKSGSSGGSH